MKLTIFERPAKWWHVALLCGAFAVFLWLMPPWVWVLANLVVNGPKLCSRAKGPVS